MEGPMANIPPVATHNTHGGSQNGRRATIPDPPPSSLRNHPITMTTTPSLSFASTPRLLLLPPPSSSPLPPLFRFPPPPPISSSFHPRPSSFPSFSLHRPSLRCFAASSIEKWILQPIGDGDCSHLDEAVPLPEPFELSTDAATVGRVPEKADIVLPIATVSGLHARLEKKGGTLFVTDLDSTNGTYIDDRQIRPGAVTPVPPGSRLTFGDDRLAAFKFSKVEVEVQSEVEN